MKTHISRLLCCIMILSMVLSVMPFGISATDAPVISADGDTVSITCADSINYIRYASGVHTSAASIKKAADYVGIDAKHVAQNTKDGVYTRMLTKSGTYTFWVRMTDGSIYIDTVEVDVAVPVFTPDGLQLHIDGLRNIKVIRTAYGDYSTAREIKNAEGRRNFTAKYDIKGKDSYTIQYRTNGLVSVSAEYYNGNIEIFKFNVEKKVPTFVQEENIIKIGNLDGLQVIRYAQGEYENASQIKRAEGSKYIRPSAAVDGIITVTLDPGTYTFSVQYKDESYNYYIVTVKGEEEPDPATNVKVSSAFTDNMVLQRDQSLSVWGTADADSGRVTVTLDGKTATALVDSYGNWKATFDETFAYNTEPQPLTVTGAEGDTVINDVLIGDMYYLVGQSNVFYSMNMLTNELAKRGEELHVDYDDSRDIRFFRISSTDYASVEGVGAQGTDTLYTDVYNGRVWLKPSDVGNEIAENIDDGYSALGYMFAYNMSHRTDVPVGIIEIDASGCPLTSFAPNELAAKWGHEAYDEGSDTYYYKIDGQETFGIKSRFMYNQAIYPLSNFATAGIVWYQGESDWNNTRESLGITETNYFATEFTELMTYFRATFGNSDFPVYMMEFPACYSNYGVNHHLDYGEVLAELGTIPQHLSDCYITSSSDLWFDVEWENNVHPPVKHYQASRLTDIVCGVKGIGDTDLNYVHGPLLNSVEYTGTGAKLTFDYVGTGLAPAHPESLGTDLRGIEVKVIENGIPVWREAAGDRIDGTNTIIIEEGVTVYGVRYHARTETNFPYNVNLCNSYGMPAIAFVSYADIPVPEIDPASVTPTATGVHVSCAFSNNMILQRDEALSVWGTANVGSGAVVVKFGGKTAVGIVNNFGYWKATFKDTFSYTTVGQPLTVIGSDSTVTFNDVLIGDVYYVVGQSNVFYSMGELKYDLQYKNMINTLSVDFSDDRDIRFFRISSTDYMGLTGAMAQGSTTLFSDVYNGEYWKKPSDISAQITQYASGTVDTEQYDRTAVSTNVFSALGYMFAYNMSNRSDVPCGVIEIDASGHPLITFAPNELADKWGHDAIGADGLYHYKLGDVAVNAQLHTRYAYNQQIYPLSNFSCAGVVWYQGESDQYNTREVFGSDYDNHFAKQFTQLMNYFRSTFGNDDFSVYLIEYPSCYQGVNGTNAFMDFGGVRAELGTIPQLLEDCYIVSSSDLWYDSEWWNNVHPYIKHYQATRLAEIVAANRLGIGNIDDVNGPVLRDVEYVGDSKAYLYFDHVGEGLTTCHSDGRVIGLEILIEYNGQQVWLTHQGNIITGTDQITVDAGSFKLLGVRYNRNYGDLTPNTLNLCNSYRMPAIAFVDYK